MKRKILSVLLTLVLVLSFSLIPAMTATVSANGTTYTGGSIEVTSLHLCELGEETEADFNAEPETLVVDGVAFDAQSRSQVTIEGQVSDLDLGAGWVDTAYVGIGLRPEATMNARNAGVYLIALNVAEATEVHLQDYTGSGRSGGVISIPKNSAFRYKITLRPSGGIGGTATLQVWVGDELQSTQPSLEYGYASTWQENVAGALDEDFSNAHLFYFISADRRGADGQNYSATVGDITIDDTLHVGTGQQFTTIQDAINFANPGDTIMVAAGTYDEQVVIDKSLTLEGEGDTTIVKPSSADVLVEHHTIPWYTGTKEVGGIITVEAGSVTVEDLQVDGEDVTAAPTGANWVAGILYWEAGGTIDNVTVVNMTVGDTGTAVRGQGIVASAVAVDASVEVMNSRVSNYDKNGINALGNQLTANIHDNTVTGRGPLPEGDEVQNGILVIHDAVGTVNNNTVSNNAYIPGDWGATGILFCNAGGSAQGNTSTNNQMGIVAQLLDGFGGSTQTVSFVGNTIDASGLEVPVITGLNAATYVDGSSLVITMDSNDLTGGSGDGISIGDLEELGAAGTVTATIMNNSIANWQQGVDLISSADAGSTVSGNSFENNDIQVSDGAEVLSIEDVFANNDFDRAVVIDRPGESLLHTIWSSIQDAIEAANPGDTIRVTAGTYDETIVVNDALDNLLLQGAGPNDTIVTGGLKLDTTGGDLIGLSVSQMAIKGNTGTYGPGVTVGHTGSGFVYGLSFDYVLLDGEGTVGMAAYINPLAGNFSFTNGEITGYEDWGVLYLGEATLNAGPDGPSLTTVTIEGNNVHNNKGSSVVYGNKDNFTDLFVLRNNNGSNNGGHAWFWAIFELRNVDNIQVEGNDLDGAPVGMEDVHGAALYLTNDNNGLFSGDIARNNFTNNWQALYVYSGDVSGLRANFNNFVGNDIAIDARGEADPTGIMDATSNWWGHASGPSGVGRGTGDAVSERVKFRPWLPVPKDETGGGETKTEPDYGQKSKEFEGTGTTINTTGTTGSGDITVTSTNYDPPPDAGTTLQAGTGKQALKYVDVKIENNEYEGDIRITISYTDEDLDRMGVNEYDLSLYYYDDDVDAWVEAANVTVDIDNNTISGDIPADKFAGLPIAGGGEPTTAIENVDTHTFYGTVQEAIDDAGVGHTIALDDGTYSALGGETFPINVHVADLTIKSVDGAAVTIIEPSSSDESAFKVTAPGVTIGGSGFTIISGGRAGIYADVAGGNGITVEDCIFKSYGDGESRGMWFEKLWGGALIAGNRFETPRVGTGIMVANADGATIRNNTVDAGTIKYAFLTFKAEAFYPDRDPTSPYAEYVAVNPSTINQVSINNNNLADMYWAVRFAASTKGSDHGEPQAQDLTVGSGGVHITHNTFAGNSSSGVKVDADKPAPDDAAQIAHIIGAQNIQIHVNSFIGNDMAVDNGQTATINAERNWWNDIAGPLIGTNPYAFWTSGDPVSSQVDYLPWLIRYDLVTGWNIVSMPIVGEEGEEEAPPEEIVAAWYFDSATQYWGADPNEAGPLDAMYIKVAAPIAIAYAVSPEVTFPSQKQMKVGWNLVGLAELHSLSLEDALFDAYWGTGEAELVGYSKVISPPLNGESWSCVRDAANPPLFPTKGYWVFMVNDGVLAGFTSTPIVEIP